MDLDWLGAAGSPVARGFSREFRGGRTKHRDRVPPELDDELWTRGLGGSCTGGVRSMVNGILSPSTFVVIFYLGTQTKDNYIIHLNMLLLLPVSF